MKLIISRNKILYILLFLPFFKPVGPAIYHIYNNIFLFYKLISMIMLAYLIIKEEHGKFSIYKNDRWFRGLILFLGIYLFNCIRNNYNLISVIANIVVIIELIIILSHTKNVNKRRNMYNALNTIFSIWLILHIISMFYIKSGHTIFENLAGDYNYFLGPDNYSAFATIPMLGAVLFFEYYKNSIQSKIKRLILTIGLCAAYVYTGAVAASVSSILLLAFYTVSKYWKNIMKIITIKKIVIFSAVCLALVVFFNVQNYFTGLLAALGKGEKGSTLNSRTIIWNMAIQLIKKNPILGIGELSEAAVNNYALYGMGHAHNLFFDLMLKTGIVGLISYLYFYVGFLTKYMKRFIKTKGVILAITIIVFFTLSMIDDYPFMQYIYCCFGLLWGYVTYET